MLIGKPDTTETGSSTGKIETLLEQLRMRQLSIEQIETFERQRAAAEKQKALSEAQALAIKQTELTNSQVQIQIAENQGNAELARARRQAEQTVVVAEAELAKARRQAEQTVVAAKADAEQKTLAGRGESQKTLQIGLSEAVVLLRKIASFGDPRVVCVEFGVGAVGRMVRWQPVGAGAVVYYRRGGWGEGAGDGARCARDADESAGGGEERVFSGGIGGSCRR